MKYATLGTIGALVACSPFGETGRADAGGVVADDAGLPSSVEPIGNGRGAGNTVLGAAPVNTYTAVLGGARTASKVLRVETPSFAAVGTVVVVWQVTTSDVPRQTPFMLDAATGRYDWFRVAAVRDAEIELDRPLTFDVGDEGAQMLSVPEYGDVMVPASVVLAPEAWDGRTGGIVAFLATGTVKIDGTVDATAHGFRGGPADEDATSDGCLDGDGLPSAGYAPKGEGIARVRFARAQAAREDTNGPFAYGNGGGGGACHNGGGAGGGHGGAGGRGGDTFTGSAPGRAADPGARVVYDPRERLALGGGGGSGERNDSPTKEGGGNGGAVVLVRARAIRGAGTIVARGSDGRKNSNDSGTGGGAGGLVVLDATEGLGCFVIDASGGSGGDSDNGGGTGGGGGPGRVALGGTRDVCGIVKAQPGRAGQESGNARGAASGEPADAIVVLAH